MNSLLDQFANLANWIKIVILVLILALFGAAYYALLYSGISNEVTQAKAKTDKLETQIKEAERREKQYLELTQELANREAIDRQNRRILPQRAEIPAFLQDLNRVAELSGLTLRVVEPRKEKREEMFAKIPVRLGVTGRFHQLGKFFFNISRLDRVISMEDINLRRPRTLSSGEIILDADVMATTFRRNTAAKKNKKKKKKKKKG